ncbi:unnamed protein product [Blepharisma stoltei]|uniref:Uncharacterized protein n=1 Tax=Blepharisma stoltei TaxID=1481888 RepID=A0AAU9JLL4_9CILI|nr:unnamed protein product [Blepharisma stoltei]
MIAKLSLLKNAARPEFHVTNYQKINFWNNFKLRWHNNKYKQLLLNTRDFAFCSELYKIIPPAEKTYTRINILFLHASLIGKNIESVNRKEYKLFNKEVDFFNKHWGVFMFENEINWKVYRELRRSWIDMCLEIDKGEICKEFIQNNIYEAEDNLNEEQLHAVVEYIDVLKDALNKLDVGQLESFDWFNLKIDK